MTQGPSGFTITFGGGCTDSNGPIPVDKIGRYEIFLTCLYTAAQGPCKGIAEVTTTMQKRINGVLQTVTVKVDPHKWQVPAGGQHVPIHMKLTKLGLKLIFQRNLFLHTQLKLAMRSPDSSHQLITGQHAMLLKEVFGLRGWPELIGLPRKQVARILALR
jgi:hypothetical protein